MNRATGKILFFINMVNFYNLLKLYYFIDKQTLRLTYIFKVMPLEPKLLIFGKACQLATKQHEGSKPFIILYLNTINSFLPKHRPMLIMINWRNF